MIGGLGPSPICGRLTVARLGLVQHDAEGCLQRMGEIANLRAGAVEDFS